MKPTALADHSDPSQPTIGPASPTHLLQSIPADAGLVAGTTDVRQALHGDEPPPLDWQSLVIGGAFVLACVGVLASLVR